MGSLQELITWYTRNLSAGFYTWL